MAVQSTYTEEPAIAFAGMLGDFTEPETLTLVNNEASAEIKFGLAVKFDAAGDDQDALILTAITNDVAGLLIHDHRYAKTSGLGATGVAAGEPMSILRKGRMWVLCESGCVPGDRMHIRALIGAGDDVGGLDNVADGVNTIDSTNQGVWLTTAAAGGLALLEVDFTGNPA